MAGGTGGYSASGGSASTGAQTGGSQSLDSSGWNVNFGPGSIESSRKESTASGDMMSNIVMIAGLLIGGLVALKFIRRGK